MTKFGYIVLLLMPLWTALAAMIFWFALGRRIAARERAERLAAMHPRQS